MAVAKDFPVDSVIQPKTNKKRKGTVLGNNLKDGDQVLAVEWEDGSLAKVNANDVELSLSMEEEFKLVQAEVNDRLNRAAQLIREAAQVAQSNGHDLLNPEYGYSDSKFEVGVIEGAMDDAGWRTSSWHC